ncbi:MAG: glycosyltransferase family 4 protein [Pseudomonadota bacterium]
MPMNSKDSLLVITELFLPTKGGTAVWFDTVYRILGGKNIHIVTANVPGADDHDEPHPNTIHRINLSRVAWLKPESLVMYIKLLLRTIRLSFQEPFRAVHAGRVLPEGLVGWVVSRLWKIPLVVYAHGEEITTWRQAVKFKAMRFTYLRADCVVANSEFTRNELLKIGMDPKKILIINPGVDTERFRPGLEVRDLRGALKLGDKDKLLLSVGRLTRRKGFDQTIKAISDLEKKGMVVHYAIAGIGEDKEYLSFIAKKYNVTDKVHFLSHVSEADLPRWYNAADIFIMPNREIGGDTEGFGMVFLEAAACEKPVIAGKAGGTGGAVLDGITGIRVDGSALMEIADSIYTLVTDEKISKRLGRNGYLRVHNGFSWDSVANRTRVLNQKLSKGTIL